MYQKQENESLQGEVDTHQELASDFVTHNKTQHRLTPY